MIYWYTGQPGHGKTLHAIKRAMGFRDEGRLVYVCNVTDFDYEKARMLPMTPQQFRDWMNFLPDGAVALVDEAYEHGMLPKRAPAAQVPPHVEQLAKHRHRGIDFIFVCQSPDRQCDSFTHDLIERHIHVRRRFGTPYQHLRTFDRFERNPEKARPLTVKRTVLPKEPMGLYKSTALDTTEKKIPWYYFAFWIGIILVPLWMWRTWGHIAEKFTPADPATSLQRSAETGDAADGASATAAASPGSASTPQTLEGYAAQFIPRVPAQPWSAPYYDSLAKPTRPPRLFCIIGGDRLTGTCTCITEQGTRYGLNLEECRTVAVDGMYEPYRDERTDQLEDVESVSQSHTYAVDARRARSPDVPGSDPQDAVSSSGGLNYGHIAKYGDMGVRP